MLYSTGGSSRNRGRSAMSIWQKEKQGKMAALAAGPAQPTERKREKYTVLKDVPVRKTTKPKADQTGTLRKGQVVFVDVRPFVSMRCASCQQAPLQLTRRACSATHRASTHVLHTVQAHRGRSRANTRPNSNTR